MLVDLCLAALLLCNELHILRSHFKLFTKLVRRERLAICRARLVASDLEANVYLTGLGNRGRKYNL